MSKPSNTNDPNSSARDSIVCPDVRDKAKEKLERFLVVIEQVNTFYHFEQRS